MSPRDPNGRYLIAKITAVIGDVKRLQDIQAVLGSEVAAYEHIGWICVAEDPEPHRPVPWNLPDARFEDDGA